jgi:hypothetical protein
MNEAYSMNSKFKFRTFVCTSYKNKLVQDFYGKVLSCEQDFQYSSFGAHSKLFHTNRNATMASSMTQATSKGITVSKPSCWKERRESLKGVQHVTTDPNDLIQSDNDDKEAQQKMDTKHGLPSNSKVRISSDCSHVRTLSVPGLSS